MYMVLFPDDDHSPEVMPSPCKQLLE
jgi:hypothetical protein